MILADASSLVDIHSHLVPGVDDGARHLPGVLNAVERMTHVGIRRMITTPHIDASLTLTPERLEARLGEVDAAYETAREAIRGEFPEVEYRRGHEVLIDVRAGLVRCRRRACRRRRRSGRGRVIDRRSRGAR